MANEDRTNSETTENEAKSHNDAPTEQGYKKEEDSQRKADAQLGRGRWSTAVETFTPMWFAVAMNTGILSILMHQLPYQFRGLPVISTVMFVFALLLLIVVSSVHILRLFIFPQSALRQTKSDPNTLCLWGCLPIAFLTVTAQVGLTVSNASWGGHPFTLVAYVMWWIGTFLIVSISLAVYITMCETQAGENLQLPTSVLLPAVSSTTGAVIGALITTYSYDISARLAVPVIITSFILLGYGLFIAIILYALILQSVFMKGIWMPAELWPSFLLLTGPMGQSAAAIQLLATAAERSFGGYNKGTFLTAMATSAISSYSVVLALLFLGFDLFWLFFALYVILKGAIRGQLSFSMTWWSTIFPVATMNVTFLALSENMDSPTFRVLTAGLLVILVIDYLVCWAFTLRDIWRGELLDGRNQLAEMAKKQD